jgi:hypothetical protein
VIIVANDPVMMTATRGPGALRRNRRQLAAVSIHVRARARGRSTRQGGRGGPHSRGRDYS